MLERLETFSALIISSNELCLPYVAVYKDSQMKQMLHVSIL